MDKRETSEDTDEDPELDDFRMLRKMLKERARRRDEESMSADADPEHEGPGPAAPTSPMRGLPLHQMQPPPQYHPPPGTTPPTTPQRQEARPGITLRSGLERTNYEEAIQIAQRMKAKRAKRRQQAKQQSSDT